MVGARCRHSNGTFTLHPLTLSRGVHPLHTRGGSIWLWMAWLIVSSFLGFVFEIFGMRNKSSKVVSFRFLEGCVSLVDPLLCILGVLHGVSKGVSHRHVKRVDTCKCPRIKYQREREGKMV